VDALIDNQVVVEIKTVSNAAIRREKDIYQLAANFICLREHGYSINAGQLLYIERTLTCMRTYEFSSQELVEYADTLVKKIKHIFDCLQTGQEAKQHLNYDLCKYCEYNHKCTKQSKNSNVVSK
jgi:CRISPR/Cas system-associated exonuclease Cas4 (RecB family)